MSHLKNNKTISLPPKDMFDEYMTMKGMTDLERQLLGKTYQRKLIAKKSQVKISPNMKSLNDLKASNEVGASVQQAHQTQRAIKSMAQAVDDEIMSVAQRSTQNFRRETLQCANDILRRMAKNESYAPADIKRLVSLSQHTQHVELLCPVNMTGLRDIGGITFHEVNASAHGQSLDEILKVTKNYHDPLSGEQDPMDVTTMLKGRYTEIMIAAESNEPKIGEHVYDRETGELLGVVSYVKDLDPRDLQTYTVYLKPNSGKSPKRTMRIKSKSIVAKASELDFPKELLQIESVASFMAWVETA